MQAAMMDVNDKAGWGQWQVVKLDDGEQLFLFPLAFVLMTTPSLPLHILQGRGDLF
jgi:hypothetical protein